MHVVVKLKNGEEVFGRMNITDENNIDLNDAMRIRYHFNDETGAPVMYFTKYSIFTESFDVTIPNDCIMHIFKDPVDNLVKFYETELIDCKKSYLEKPKSNKKYEKDESLVAMMEMLRGDYEVH
jgi:small nuclear ribonucleoprotein (snRNP)-like protein